MNVVISIRTVYHVLVVPEISSSEGTYITSEQTPVNFQCTATSIPPPEITWYRNGTVLLTDPRASVNSSDAVLLPSSLLYQVTQNLTLMDTEDSDSGSYTCMANSSAGVDTAEFQLVVRSKCY